MRLAAMLIPIGVIAVLPAAAIAAPPSPAEPPPVAASPVDSDVIKADASIAFANHGGVQDWRADGTRTVYFRDQHNRWYRAELLGTAVDLPFVEDIGIDPNADGSLDRFGAIIVHGQRYAFTSFDEVAGPPARAGKDRKVPKEAVPPPH